MPPPERDVFVQNTENEPGQSKHSGHNTDQHQQVEGPSLASDIEEILEPIGAVDEYEKEEKRRQDEGVLNLVPVAFRDSQSGVHSLILSLEYIVTNFKIHKFSHKFRQIFTKKQIFFIFYF